MIKKLKNTLATLFFVANALYSSNAMSQTDYMSKNWIIVTKDEFKRRNIHEDSIQFVDIRKSEKDLGYTDHSKLGKIYIDRAGGIYRWINLHPTTEAPKVYWGGQVLDSQVSKEGNEKTLTEAQKLESLVSDPEIKKLIDGFNTSFELEYPYAYLGEDIKRTVLWKKGSKVMIPIEIQERHPRGIILKNKELNKDLLIPKNYKSNYYLEYFLTRIHAEDIKYAIQHTIHRKNMELFDKREKRLETFEEKKAFIKPYFTDSIPNAIKNFAEYNAPKIYKDEWLMTFTEGGKVQYKNDIKLDDVKPTKLVVMNEQKLNEILK